ncbi:MAG: TIGR01777 family protein [Bacteroidetes bacterium]|nr:TIGR01777 family protein [Bacteroidota bacterium]
MKEKNKFRKIILAGGSGYMGTVLADFFSDRCDEIVILTRRIIPQRKNIRTVSWDAKRAGEWKNEIENSDLVINLTGKSVNCRYNKKNREEILDSRLNATNILGQVIAQCKNPPRVWINCASATIYRHAEDRAMDETTGEIGKGFSVEVCKAWEKTFFAQETPRTRKVALRVGIVLGPDDGVFPRLKNLVRFGLGGRHGNGQQRFTWIHERDMARVMEWIVENKNATGIYNCTAPDVHINKDAMKIIREEMKKSFGLPAFTWMLTIGAILIGTETELLLKSRWVVPARLLSEGFRFEFPQFREAIHNIVKASNL